MISTVGDLMRWQSALFGGEVLPPPVFREMTSPGKLKNGERIVTQLSESGYGYGLFLINFNGHEKIGHTGGELLKLIRSCIPTRTQGSQLWCS